jgi:hypothetical protein
LFFRDSRRDAENAEKTLAESSNPEVTSPLILSLYHLSDSDGMKLAIKSKLHRSNLFVKAKTGLQAA